MRVEYKIIDPAGLHARPVSLMVDLAMKFDGEVSLIYKEKTVSVKSILSVMSLGIPVGESFAIEVSGDKSDSFVHQLTELLKEHNVV